jgi:putative hydrolase of the HAD superfamily
MEPRGLVLDYGGVLTDSDDGAESPLFALVRRVRRSGIRTAVLSNADAYAVEPAWSDLFDAVVLSGVVGVAKPDPESYQITARRLGLAPRQCVFVDDLRSNVAGAVAVGMIAVHHRDVRTTVDELEVLFERELLG